ncbi:hypothetical protein [Lysobacter gummosus]
MREQRRRRTLETRTPRRDARRGPTGADAATSPATGAGIIQGNQGRR